jgi:hypothetical protein
MSVKITKIYSLIPLYYTSNHIEVYNYSGWNVFTRLNGEGLVIRRVGIDFRKGRHRVYSLDENPQVSDAPGLPDDA